MTPLYILAWLPLCAPSSGPAMSYLLVTRVGPCHERKQGELVFVSEMSLHKVKYASSLTGDIYIAEDITNGWTVRATMQKCHDIRNLDTCDFYKAVPLVKSGCLDSDEAEVYTTFFQYVSPQMECPVRAGNYSITEFPFFAEDSDLTAAKSKISTSVFGYTYRLEGYDEDDNRVLCVEAHLRLNYIRLHAWGRGQGAGAASAAPTPREGDSTKAGDDDE